MKKIILLILLLLPSLCFSAPTEIAGDTARFSWTASLTPNVTYNVYVDDVKINKTMIIGASFNYVIPVEWYGVVKTSIIKAEDEREIESLKSNPAQFIKKRPIPIEPNQNPVTESVGR